jgi:hypothetical protein
VQGGEDPPWEGATSLFDLETVPEKIDRCRRSIADHPDLRMKGGHVPLEEIRAALEFPDPVFEQALGEVLGSPEGLQVREIDGIRILQRPRF